MVAGHRPRRPGSGDFPRIRREKSLRPPVIANGFGDQLRIAARPFWAASQIPAPVTPGNGRGRRKRRPRARRKLAWGDSR